MTTMTWYQRAREVKEARKMIDATIAADFGDEGISRSLVNHWFNGVRESSITQFLQLASILGCDPLYLLTGEGRDQSLLPPDAIKIARAWHESEAETRHAISHLLLAARVSRAASQTPPASRPDRTKGLLRK